MAQHTHLPSQARSTAKSIVRAKLKYEAAHIELLWLLYNFSISFDQSLIVAREDEARWLINNNLTVEKQVPDLLDYIYVDGLQAVKPNAVNVICSVKAYENPHPVYH